jgi:hypothetical protein
MCLFRFFQIIGLLLVLSVTVWLAWLGFIVAKIILGLLIFFIVCLVIGIGILTTVLGTVIFWRIIIDN